MLGEKTMRVTARKNVLEQPARFGVLADAARRASTISADEKAFSDRQSRLLNTIDKVDAARSDQSRPV